jgi:FkbM family methyltransferase
MLLDHEDLVQREIMLTGGWEPNTWRSISANIGKGGVLVDVGAHVGYCSLKAANVVGPSGHVLAIEPNPDTLQTLRANIQANGDNMIAVEPVACSDSDSMVEFFAAARKNTGASSMSESNASNWGPVGKSFQVRARPLDALIMESGLARVDVIKIDVEGAEFLVLKGAQQTLDRYHPVIVMELEEGQLKSMGTSSAEILALLRSHGYTPRHSSGEAENNNTEFVFTPNLARH